MIETKPWRSEVLVIYTPPFNSKTIREEVAPTLWEKFQYVRYYHNYTKTIDMLRGTMFHRVILADAGKMHPDFLKYLETRIEK